MCDDDPAYIDEFKNRDRMDFIISIVFASFSYRGTGYP